MSNRKIKMFKDGEYIDWDGTDIVTSLIVEETLTLSEMKKYYPKEYPSLKREADKRDKAMSAHSYK